jgi:hypothetical protein
MAIARFHEITRCSGVTEDAQPPGMVVDIKSANVVALETFGMDLSIQAPPSIDIMDFDRDGQQTTSLLGGVRDALMKPGVDSQFRDAYMPTDWRRWNKPRLLRIFGKIPTGFPGLTVRAVPKRRAQGLGAELKVAVVDRMIIKVAIRNVTARDQQGSMRYHANRPCHPETEVANMNAVWTPQTNIEFELVPSTDLVVDNDDPETEKELRKAYGMQPTGPKPFYAEGTVWWDKTSKWFARHKVPGAHMTFFFMHKVWWGGSPEYGRGGYDANGAMDRQSGVSFISATLRTPSTFAHEAGHFVGNMWHKGTDHRLLMRDDGGGYKIPFDLAEKFRGFRLKPGQGWTAP